VRQRGSVGASRRFLFIGLVCYTDVCMSCLCYLSFLLAVVSIMSRPPVGSGQYEPPQQQQYSSNLSDEVDDPYPEDDDTPNIFDATSSNINGGSRINGTDMQQHEYDDSELVGGASTAVADEEYAAVPAEEANIFLQEQQGGEEEAITYQPAPVQQPQRHVQQQRRHSQLQRGQPRPPIAASTVEEDPFADPNSPSYEQPAPAAAAAVPAAKKQRRPAGTAAPKQSRTSPSPAPAAAPASGGMSRSTSAQNIRGAASAQPSSTTSTAAAAPIRPASAAPHSVASPVSATSPPSALLRKMDSVVRHNVKALEHGGELLLNSIRGIEAPGSEKQTVEDEQLASHNYDLMEDHINTLALDSTSKMRSEIQGHILTFLQLLLTIAVAFLTALAMFCVSRVVEVCAEWRIETTLDLIREQKPYGAYLALLGISLSLAFISTVLVVFLAPHAKGGGVPYVQAYLNGTNVASYFSTRIVLVKIIALGFTIAAGFSLGMEGPFVFIGSGIAIILNKSLEYLSFHNRLGGRYARILKNINEERVFMAGGMAAGLAVAFNAPIAGVLMALEGSTAFLTVPVVLRIFGCAMFATFFNDIWHSNFGASIKTHNLIIIEGSSAQQLYAWDLWEIVAFTGIALIGGALGALAIWVNVKVTKWRHHHVEPHPPKNELNTSFAVKEVLVLMFLTSTVWFILPYIFGCRPQHEQCFPTIAIPHRCTAVQCPSNFYSEIGTIIYGTPDNVARIMFDRTLLTANEYSPAPLLIYAGFYMCFVAAVYGAHVPGGLFVPSVVVGGCVGRAFGSLLHTYVSAQINPGVYALLGAASMFGGFTRLVLPAAVMLIEMTGDSTYLLPIMFCTVVSKVVSDEIQPPLYPQHMAIEGIPTLGDKLNPLIAPLQAKHIMNKNFYSVKQLDTLEHILHVLDKSRSMLLPVVTHDGSGKFVGMVMRRSVLYALKYTKLYKDEKEFLEETADLTAAGGAAMAAVTAASSNVQTSNIATSISSPPTVTAGAGGTQRRVTSSMLEVEKKMGDHRSTQSEDTLEKFDDKFAQYLVNITPFMDAGTLTAYEETSAKRIAAIFRRLGISHLGVADGTNKLVGVITRRHLIKPPVAVVAPSLSPSTVPITGTSTIHAPDSVRAVTSILENDGLEPSPDTVFDLVHFNPSNALESEAMTPLRANQYRASRASRRTQSIFNGEDPSVMFDDEEDAPVAGANAVDDVDEPYDDDDMGGGGGTSNQDQLYDAGDESIGGGEEESKQSSSTSAAHISVPIIARKQSSLSRLTQYTRQV
jgi:chloride channel 7